MDDERTARPVSGEIMTADTRAAQQAPRPFSAGDVVDVDFEEIAGGGSSPDGVRPEPVPPVGPTADLDGMTSLRRGADGAAARNDGRGGPVFWLTGLFLVAAAFWLSGGYAVIARSPLAFTAASDQALRIDHVSTNIQTHSGRQFLLVDGEAVNPGEAPLRMEPIVIAVAGADGTTTRYFLGTNGRVLQPHERYAFSSRLEAPTHGVDKVTVKFSREGD